jgi:hypothetical protein
VGTVSDPWRDAVDDGKRSMIFETFLASPLLPSGGLYKERKFSGSKIAGHNVDGLGQAVDAYAHHVLADSGGEMLLTDLQGAFSRCFTWELLTNSNQELSVLTSQSFSLIHKLTRRLSI